MAALPLPKSSPHAREAQKIKEQIDATVSKMNKNNQYTPTRDELENIAETIIHYIAQRHAKAVPHHSYLKAAVIDLTEVPEMSPEMQRIAYLTALQDSSHEIAVFLSCL